MLNYEVQAGALKPFLPAGTELDSWEGAHYLSVVGFLFQDTRVLGVPVPLHRDFEEVNLRFYVRRDVDGERRRGVVFVREFVPRRSTAFVARRVYEESYTAAPMRHVLEPPDLHAPKAGHVAYRWRYPTAWNSLSAEFSGAPSEPAPGSHEEFITEHYWGYVAKRRGTLEYRVEHPRWKVWSARSASLECDTVAVYGPGFAEALSREPVSALVADGSAVAVCRGVPLDRE